MCRAYLYLYVILCFFFFFFQAEDGIRDVAVTGVQTCALPISSARRVPGGCRRRGSRRPHRGTAGARSAARARPRARGRSRRRSSPCPQATGRGDRKSTRLNSSHGYISYAVFCLKKKKNKKKEDCKKKRKKKTRQNDSVRLNTNLFSSTELRGMDLQRCAMRSAHREVVWPV